MIRIVLGWSLFGSSTPSLMLHIQRIYFTFGRANIGRSQTRSIGTLSNILNKYFAKLNLLCSVLYACPCEFFAWAYQQRIVVVIRLLLLLPLVVSPLLLLIQNFRIHCTMAALHIERTLDGYTYMKCMNHTHATLLCSDNSVAYWHFLTHNPCTNPRHQNKIRSRLVANKKKKQKEKNKLNKIFSDFRVDL